MLCKVIYVFVDLNTYVGYSFLNLFFWFIYTEVCLCVFVEHFLNCDQKIVNAFVIFEYTVHCLSCFEWNF